MAAIVIKHWKYISSYDSGSLDIYLYLTNLYEIPLNIYSYNT